MRYSLVPASSLLCLLLAPAPALAQGPAAPADPTPAAPGGRSGAPGEGPPAAAPALPNKIGPFVLRTADGGSSLQPGFTLQLQVREVSKDQGQDLARLNEATFIARRIRPTLGGTLLTADLSYYLHLSTAPGSLELMDAYLDYQLLRHLRLRGGQFKVPFTRYRIQSFKNLTLVDWSINTKWFGAERQMGLALHNGYEKPPAWAYELGVFTGANARASHEKGLAGLYGEALPNPSDLTDPAPPPGVHPELVTHLSYNPGGIDVSTDTDGEGGGLRGSGGLSAAWDLAPTAAIDMPLRLAAELLLKLRGASLAAAFYLGLFAPAATPEDPAALGLLGVQLQASYLLCSRVELAARYARVDVRGALRRDAQARAAARVAAAADEAARAALEKQYAAAGQLQDEQELTVGANLYLVGRSLKWQNDLTLLFSERPGATRLDLTFRSQVQLAF